MTIKTLKIVLLLAFSTIFSSCATPPKQTTEPLKITVNESSPERMRSDLRTLAKELSRHTLPEARPRIAVIGFSDIQNNVPVVSNLISETLISELFKTGKYDIIERKLLSGVLEQQKLNLSGLVDEATARKVGKLLGVDYIVSGTLIELGGVLNVNARMVSIETGAIAATASVDLNKAELRDVSAGREATNSLEDMPPAEGVFTQWMDAEAFGKEMDRRWKEGFHPAIVEGRDKNGRSEFRGAVRAFPKKVFWFYWWYGQLRSQYEEHRNKLAAEGFKEIYMQVFTDREGMKRYQTCWIKYGN